MLLLLLFFENKTRKKCLSALLLAVCSECFSDPGNRAATATKNKAENSEIELNSGCNNYSSSRNSSSNCGKFFSFALVINK